MIGGLFITLTLALAALVLCGRFLIRLLSNVTTAFGLSEFSVAFIFLAVATSLPELFVAIASAQQHAGDIVIAVALGSNVVNMTLIIGAAALLSAGIPTTGLNLRRDIFIGSGITLLPILFLLNGIISRFEGVLLLLAFSYYMYLLYRDRNTFNGAAAPRRILRGVASIFGILLLVGVLLVASNATVDSSVQLATAVGIPTFLIGLFLLAIGTSLPELTTTFSSALQRRPAMALGGILGSNVADSALIIGIASLVRPLEVTVNLPLVTTAAFVVIALVILGDFAFTRQRISIAEGLWLLFAFAMFTGTMLIVSVPF